MTTTRGLALASFALLATATSSAQTMPKSLFPGAATGVLSVRIELTGAHTKHSSNGVERYGLSSNRILDLKLTMLDPGNPEVPLVPVAGHDVKSANAASMPPGLAELAAAMEACGNDEGCQQREAMRLAPKMQANPQSFDRTKGKDRNRYQNWIDDRRVDCVRGTLTVNDVGEGMSIDPPHAAKPYRFERKGQLKLPNADHKIIDGACRAEITFDKVSGKASLKLPVGKLTVPVQITGNSFINTNEKSVPFLSGVDKVSLPDLPAGKIDGWSGSTTMKLGTVSHNSDQVVVPMNAKISWRFDVD